MGKMEYLDALKRAMLGLPPDVQAKTLAYYEQRFVDGEAAGRNEQDVGRELDDPTRIALTLRTSAHLSKLGGFEQKKNPANVLRMLVSGVGLAIFNLFMIVPAMVYSALLLAVYVCALTFYLAGIATTASGLAGTNELVLDWPSRFVHLDDDSRQLRIQIDNHGINVHPERAPAALASSDAVDAPDADESAHDAAGQNRDDSGDDTSGDARRRHSRVLRGAEAVADGAVHITTGMDAQSRTTQTLFGFGLVLGGIALCLLALVITRYTLVGLKRYLQMNWSLLRGNGA
jgi:uncharacterized membrane protein